jgi:hypothetical protein
MNDQSRPEQPEDGQGTGNFGAEGALPGAASDAARRETPKKTAGKSASGVPATEQYGKARLTYLDPSGSESTREMRDTARRRRDAEEKLQQHLNEAKDHVPNEHHGEDPSQ